MDYIRYDYQQFFDIIAAKQNNNSQSDLVFLYIQHYHRFVRMADWVSDLLRV